MHLCQIKISDRYPGNIEDFRKASLRDRQFGQAALPHQRYVNFLNRHTKTTMQGNSRAGSPATMIIAAAPVLINDQSVIRSGSATIGFFSDTVLQAAKPRTFRKCTIGMFMAAIRAKEFWLISIRPSESCKDLWEEHSDLFSLIERTRKRFRHTVCAPGDHLFHVGCNATESLESESPVVFRIYPIRSDTTSP